MTTNRPLPPKELRWIWPFELIEQIGEGGMGLVYRAKYVVNGVEVALKMLPSDVNDKTALARFERELEVLKNMKHPNIVRCFGGTCENHRRFYAMELVEGGTLEDKLQEKKRLPWEEVVYYALQMCEALKCSHGKGVVHRDIKPANFLLTPSGQLKLSDFGLASVADSRRITAAGKTAGTFLYMAPEQIQGREITDKTDLYALGCVLYELITGNPPFLGETPAATLHMHCKNVPARPTETAFDCPIALERIILSLLEKEPADRPESAEAVSSELRSVKQTVVVTRPTPQQLSARSPAEFLQQLEKPKPPPVAQHWHREPEKRFGGINLVLGILLACSLGWNLMQLIQRYSGNIGEQFWVEAAKHQDAAVRAEAMKSIGKILGRTGRHLSLLESSLRDEDEKVRVASVQGISNGGAQSLTVIPQLINIQKTDESANVRQAAGLAISKLHKDFPDGAPSSSWIGWITTIALLIGIPTGIYFWFQSSR